MLSLLVSHTRYRNSHKYLIDLLIIHRYNTPVAMTLAFHASDRGSNPSLGIIYFFFFVVVVVFCLRLLFLF